MKLNEKYKNNAYILFKDDRTKIHLKDKEGGKVSYGGTNNENHEVVAYRIDNGIMKDVPGKQCDYGLYTVSSSVMRLIELKGSDCSRAAKQIMESIKFMVNGHNDYTSKIHGRIVLSKARTPELNSTHEIRLKKLLKSRNGNLKIASRQMNEIID